MYRIPILLFSLIYLSCSGTMQHVADAEVNYIETNEDTEANVQSVADMIAPYKEALDDQMGEVLGVLPEDLKKDRPYSNMGNWFCDALQYIAEQHAENKPSFSLQNYGGLRLPFLAKGPLTRSDVYELMPFDNKLVVLGLEGEKMQLLLDQIASDGGWPVSKGLSFDIKDDKATNILIEEKPFDANGFYYVALPDYVANGGGGTHFLKNITQEETGFFIRDAILAYLDEMNQMKKSLTIDHTKRIRQ